MASYLFLIPALPCGGHQLLLGRTIIRDKAHWIAVPAVFASWVLSRARLLRRARQGRSDSTSTSSPGFRPALSTFQVSAPRRSADRDHAAGRHQRRLPGAHSTRLATCTGDRGYYRFFSYLPLFVFSMLMLVLADNFLLLFVFWEAVGLCSYLLIGYYFKRRSANNAAKKAFIVNRIGDLGFGLGIMWIFSAFGTLQFFGDTRCLRPGRDRHRQRAR